MGGSGQWWVSLRGKCINSFTFLLCGFLCSPFFYSKHVLYLYSGKNYQLISPKVSDDNHPPLPHIPGHGSWDCSQEDVVVWKDRVPQYCYRSQCIFISIIAFESCSSPGMEAKSDNNIWNLKERQECGMFSGKVRRWFCPGSPLRFSGAHSQGVAQSLGIQP